MNGPNSLAITVLVAIVADLMHHLQQPEEKSRIKATLPQVDLTPATAILKQGLLLLSRDTSSLLVIGAFTEGWEDIGW